LASLKKISPMAWRHILRGYFFFSNNAKLIDLDMIENLIFQSKKYKVTKNNQGVYELTA